MQCCFKSMGIAEEEREVGRNIKGETKSLKEYHTIPLSRTKAVRVNIQKESMAIKGMQKTALEEYS